MKKNIGIIDTANLAVKALLFINEKQLNKK
jgi:hypothetical protein